MKTIAIPLLAALLGLTAPAMAAPVPPSRAADLITQARAAQTRGEAELALRLAQAAIVAQPANTLPYVALGDIYAAQGQAEYARVYYDAALHIEPSDSAALAAILELDRRAPLKDKAAPITANSSNPAQSPQ